MIHNILKEYSIKLHNYNIKECEGESRIYEKWNTINNQIDRFVYELYGLTEEDKNKFSN